MHCFYHAQLFVDSVFKQGYLLSSNSFLEKRKRYDITHIKSLMRKIRDSPVQCVPIDDDCGVVSYVCACVCIGGGIGCMPLSSTVCASGGTS